ncbi:pheromone A receptor-domain-containing protein [Lipomyces chichibuensis]|uniref:pheromone A receptor-domain-containing protein n=1 Tax=Lipomyces chichibuensis TaxID=1546026 RepID=UPI0033440A13
MINVPLFVCGVLSLILSASPFFWNFRHRNLSATIFVIYVIVANITIIIQASLYGGPDVSKYWDGKGLCDIIGRLPHVCGMGIICSLASMSRTLARILSKNVTLSVTVAQRRRELIVELLICVGFPLLSLATFYIYQPFRYVLLQHSGCIVTFDYTWASFWLYTFWQPFFPLVSAIYSAITIYRYFQRRRQFREVLRSSQSGLTVARFARLLFFCITVMFVELPLAIVTLVTNVRPGIHVFNFSKTHANWNAIPRLAASATRKDFFYFTIVSALLFVYFGFGVDARHMYHDWLILLGFGKLFPNSKWLAKHDTFSDSTGTQSIHSTMTSGTCASRPTRFDTWETMHDIELGSEFGEKFDSVDANSAFVIGGVQNADDARSESSTLADGLEPQFLDKAIKIKYEVRIEK